MKSSEIVRRPLEAPPGIALYVHHCIFKQPTEGTKQLLTGLASKVTNSEDVVYLEGPCDVVSENEKKLLEYFVTSELECKEFPFSTDCRFISHIESEVLRQLHQKKTFTHVFTRHSKEDSAQQSGRSSRQGRHHSSSSEGSSKGFTISIYSTSTEDFQHVCSEMEVCYLSIQCTCTCNFTYKSNKKIFVIFSMPPLNVHVHVALVNLHVLFAVFYGIHFYIF